MKGGVYGVIDRAGNQAIPLKNNKGSGYIESDREWMITNYGNITGNASIRKYKLILFIKSLICIYLFLILFSCEWE